MIDALTLQGILLGGISVVFLGVIVLAHGLLRPVTGLLRTPAQVVIFGLLVGIPLLFVGLDVGEHISTLSGRALEHLFQSLPLVQLLVGTMAGIFALPVDHVPGLWLGLGGGMGLGLGFGLAAQQKDPFLPVRPPASADATVTRSTGALASAAAEAGGTGPLAFLWGVVVALVFGTPLGLGVASSLTQFQQTYEDEVALGAVIGILTGTFLGYAAGLLVDLGSSIVYLVTHGTDRPIFDKAGCAVSCLFWLGLFLTAWAATIVEAAHQGSVLSAVGQTCLLPVAVVVACAFGAFHGFVNGITGGPRAAIADDERGPRNFDIYGLVGGLIAGLIIGFGGDVPLLGFILGLAGSIGIAGIGVGVVLGLVLGFAPLIKRGIDAMPTLGLCVLGGALLAIGGIMLSAQSFVS